MEIKMTKNHSGEFRPGTIGGRKGRICVIGFPSVLGGA